MRVLCIRACRAQQGQGCTVLQGHKVFHELSRIMVFEQKKTHTHALYSLEQISEQRTNGVGATKVGTPQRAILGCRDLWTAQGCSHPLGHLLLVGKVLACATQKGLYSKIEGICGHVDFCRQEAPVPCTLKRVLSQDCWLHSECLPG